MKLKKSYKILIGLCAVLLYVVVNVDTILVNSIAAIGGGYLQDAIYIVPFMG